MKSIFLAIFLTCCITSLDAVERGSIIPLYIWPRNSDGSDAWKPLKDAFKAYPIEVWAIVNVFNGPGQKLDSTYKTAISSLKTLGIKTLGYVRTNYSRRAASAVRQDMDKWRKLYQPDGIFFDEMTNDNSAAHISYYTRLDGYAKSKNFTLTVGNPGSAVPIQYFETVDTIMIFEEARYPPHEKVCNQAYQGLPEKEALGIFPYNVPALNASAVRRAKECVGFIYLTNDSGDNPWDTLPPYLTELFRILSED